MAVKAQEPLAPAAVTIGRSNQHGVERRAEERHTALKPKIKLNQTMYVASINIQGMMRVAKREEIENWMYNSGVKVMAVQETHIPTSHQEVRKHYTWYFSGASTDPQKAIHTGVAIVVANDFRNYVKDVEPINDRIMAVTLRGPIPVKIYSVYAPTAMASEATKTSFYTTLSNSVRPCQSKCIVYVMGDFNARVQAQQPGEEIAIGPHTFDAQADTLGRASDEVGTNRSNFIEFAIATKMIAANTYFMKQEKHKATYKEDKSHRGGPPYKRGTYEALDYILAMQRWKNTIKDASADHEANIQSDHYPLWMKVSIKFKARTTQYRKIVKYAPCSVEQRDQYNAELKAAGHDGLGYSSIMKRLQAAANSTIPTIIGKEQKEAISEETRFILSQRGDAIRNQDYNLANDLTKQLKKSKRWDRRKLTIETVSRDLDVRDHWLGLKQLRKGFTPTPYARKDATKKHIPMEQRAEESAKYFAEKVWSAPKDEEGQIITNSWPEEEYPEIVTEDLSLNEGPITKDELISIIKRLKRRKTPGPDETSIELFKELDSDNLQQILELLNQWWAERTVPEEILKARLVLIFKKGDTNNLGNYRPISLLNTIYKVLAAIIQERLAAKLEPHLQRMQFGFRKHRGTADALHCVRRIIDKGEMTNTKTLMVLLDWEKAFDKVSHEGLYSALERMGVRGHTLDIIKSMYANPLFHVEIDGIKSKWYKQETGIRQGCPLSPYMFIILMTVMFHDIHRKGTMRSTEHGVKGANFDEVFVCR